MKAEILNKSWNFSISFYLITIHLFYIILKLDIENLKYDKFHA